MNVIAIVVRPTPKRFDSRCDTSAPTRPPRLPSVKMIPISAAESSSVRTAYTRKIENITFEKKFEVPVQIACGRSSGCRTT